MEEEMRDACARLFPEHPQLPGQISQLVDTYRGDSSPFREEIELNQTDAVLILDRERISAIRALGNEGIERLYQLLDDDWEGAISAVHLGSVGDWYGIPLVELSREILLLMSLPTDLVGVEPERDSDSVLRGLEEMLRGIAAGIQAIVCPPGIDERLITLIRSVALSVDPAVAIVHRAAPVGDIPPIGLPFIDHGNHRQLDGIGSSGILRCTGRDVDPLLPDRQRARSILADLSVDFARAGVPALTVTDLFPEATGTPRQPPADRWPESCRDPESLYGAVREGVLALIRAHASDPAFAPGAADSTLPCDDRLVAVRRDGPDGTSMICIHNLSDDLVEFRDRRDKYPWPETGVVRDLITDDLVYATREGPLFSLEIEPWEVLWLRFGPDPVDPDAT